MTKIEHQIDTSAFQINNLFSAHDLTCTDDELYGAYWHFKHNSVFEDNTMVVYYDMQNKLIYKYSSTIRRDPIRVYCKYNLGYLCSLNILGIDVVYS